MSLVDDLKTFLTALAIGVALTLSINYVVVNYTHDAAAANAARPVSAVQNDYQSPLVTPKYDTGGSYSSSYY